MTIYNHTDTSVHVERLAEGRAAGRQGGGRPYLYRMS